MSQCFHCTLPVPHNTDYQLTIDDEEQCFCCQGCLSVAMMIHGAGLDAFYQYRDSQSPKAQESTPDYHFYNDPAILEGFSERDDSGHLQLDFVLNDIHCAACVWLIEQCLSQQPALVNIKVNSVTRHAHIVWQDTLMPVGQLMQLLAGIGYPPQPLVAGDQHQAMVRTQRKDLMRIGVAGFAMMQVMMMSAAIYLGGEKSWELLFRWVSLVVSTPVLLFSAKPFWQAAWRSLKSRQLIMDVPVALAIVLAYAASVWATVTQTGEVYYDSIAMFTFFLLVSRYLEKRLRLRNAQTANRLTSLLPLTVNRINRQGLSEIIPLVRLELGDTIRVNGGDTIACDGQVLEGTSGVVQAFLTGESVPVIKQVGQEVMAGSINTDSPLTISVGALGRNTRLSAIERLVARAQLEKPSWQQLADRVARYFVLAVLIIASTVFTAWYFIEPADALWVTLSVLVVTCPCALSLATPAAFTASLNALQRKGILLLQSSSLETLRQIKTVVFDKTGTLTEGRPSVLSVDVNNDSPHNEAYLCTVAAALEEGSRHPIAQAFLSFDSTLTVSEREHHTSLGVSGTINGLRYQLGSAAYVGCEDSKPGIYLSENGCVQARFNLSDKLRPSASKVVSALKSMGLEVAIASGDHAEPVACVAKELGVDDARASATPEDKIAFIKQAQARGGVLMVGDGVNDAPVLAMADVSIAMNHSSDLAKTQADGLLLTDDLTLLESLLKQAASTQKIILQNITWALVYNGLALPLAALGIIPPYLAAAGMSLSSLIVVVNALRLYRF